jgi:large subunit ribosomal protein L21
MHTLAGPRLTEKSLYATFALPWRRPKIPNKVEVMIAVILTGGKQYKVKEGEVLDIEKIGVETGRPFEFSKVLLIADGTKVMIGTPFISNAGVRAEVLEHRKGDKVLIFKKKRRKQYRRFKGHRQELVRVRITDIIPDLTQAPVKKAAPAIEKAAVQPPVRPEAAAPAKPASKPAVKPAAKPAEKPKIAEKPAAPAKGKKPVPAKSEAKPAKAAKAEKSRSKAAAKKAEPTKVTPKAKKTK